MTGTIILQNIHSAQSLAGSAATGKADTFISVDPTKKITPIPARYVGMSFETSNLCNMTGAWNTPVFEQLFKNLGPQLIRIGGNAADRALWNPDGTASCSSTKTVLTKSLITSFFTFASRVNAKVIWTLNLGNYAPSTYSQEASFVVSKGKEVGGSAGSFLWALGIGNEPDLYIGNGTKPSTYTVNSYVSEWKNYKNTIRNTLSQQNYKFMANDNCCNDKWFDGLISQERDSLSLITHHFYPTRSDESGARAATIENLLSPALMQNTTKDYLDKWVATANGIPVAVNETNSTAGGGLKGLSDTFASSLWAVDYMYMALQHGVKYVNFHTGASPSIYSPITNYEQNTWIARPLYYALLFFRSAAPDGNIVSSTIQTPYNVVSYSTVDGKNILRTAIINKDLKNNSIVQVTIPQGYKTASTLSLVAPSVTATKDVSFGGNQVKADGSWKGDSTPITIENSKVTLSVPMASAVLLILQR